MGGSGIKRRASCWIVANSKASSDPPYYHYFPSDGALVEGLAPRQPRDNMNFFGLFDYAVTKDQTLRMSLGRNQSTGKNIGIGGLNLLERGYATEDNTTMLRIQEAGPLGRRLFLHTPPPPHPSPSAPTSPSPAPAHPLTH